MAHSIKPRIMYIECKGGGMIEMSGHLVPADEGDLTGPARIGRVTFNRTGKTLFYGGRSFQRCEGFKSNYICIETKERFWISGPKKRGGDGLYATNIAAKIDDDVREEYWTMIRNCPDKVNETEAL
ncbi:MAG TPA: hypothetical protein VF865_16240 [Acidobacteriaceae bacterium]